MMLRTSLPATGSIVKKTSRDCAPCGMESVRLEGLTGKRGAMMTLGCGGIRKVCGRATWITWTVSGLVGFAGCGHAIPVAATLGGGVGANVLANATVKGDFEVKLPAATDPGDMTITVVAPGGLKRRVRGSHSLTWMGCC